MARRVARGVARGTARRVARGMGRRVGNGGMARRVANISFLDAVKELARIIKGLYQHIINIYEHYIGFWDLAGGGLVLFLQSTSGALEMLGSLEPWARICL